MKIKSLIFSVAALVLCVAACKKEDAAPVVTPSLSVSGLADNKISTGTDGGSATFTVTANVDWSVASNADWVSVNPASEKISGGTEKATVVTVTVQKSADGKARVAELTVSADKVSPVKISVSQSEKIDVVCKADVTDIPVSGDGGEFTVKVTANNSWAFKAVNSTWVSVDPQSKDIALGTSTETAVKVKVEKNEGAEARSEKLIIECDGAKNVEINVTQESGACYVTVYDSNLEEVSQVSFPFKGGKKTIVVDTDAASAPEIERSADWLGVTFADDFVPGEFWNCEILTGANPTGEAREGTIKFKVKGAEAVVTVKQEKGVSLSVSVDEITYKSAKVTFTPSSDDFTYYYQLFTEGLYNQLTDKGYTDDMILLAYAKANAEDEGMSLSAYLDQVMKSGTKTINYIGLPENTKLVGLCAGMLNDGSFITQVVKYDFTTPEKPKSDPAYAALLGKYKFTAYDYFNETDVTGNLIVREDKINETFGVAIQGCDWCPDYYDTYGEDYIDYFSSPWQNENSIVLVNGTQGDFGTWNYGSLGDCYIQLTMFFAQTEDIDITNVVLTANETGLSAVEPAIPEGDAICLESEIISPETGKTGYANGILIFDRGLNFTKVGTPAATASQTKKVFASEEQIKALSPKKKFNCVEKCFANKSFKVRNAR